MVNLDIFNKYLSNHYSLTPETDKFFKLKSMKKFHLISNKN